jgi:hypothetical protein
MVSQTYEGKWEEIARQHGSELAGQQVRLTILGQASTNQGLPPNAEAIAKIKEMEAAFPPGTTLADAMKDYVGKFSSAEPHNDSANVEKIFGDYVMEKHRKRQERRS